MKGYLLKLVWPFIIFSEIVFRIEGMQNYDKNIICIFPEKIVSVLLIRHIYLFKDRKDGTV